MWKVSLIPRFSFSHCWSSRWATGVGTTVCLNDDHTRVLVLRVEVVGVIWCLHMTHIRIHSGKCPSRRHSIGGGPIRMRPVWVCPSGIGPSRRSYYNWLGCRPPRCTNHRRRTDIWIWHHAGHHADSCLWWRNTISRVPRFTSAYVPVHHCDGNPVLFPWFPVSDVTIGNMSLLFGVPGCCLTSSENKDKWYSMHTWYTMYRYKIKFKKTITLLESILERRVQQTISHFVKYNKINNIIKLVMVWIAALLESKADRTTSWILTWSEMQQNRIIMLTIDWTLCFL